MKRWIKVLLIDCMLIAVYCGVKVVLCLWNDKPVDWEEILLIGAAVAVPYYVLAYLMLYMNNQVKIKRTDRDNHKDEKRL